MNLFEMNPAIAIYYLLITQDSFLQEFGRGLLGRPATIRDLDCDSFLEWIKYCDEIEDFVINGTGDPSDPPVGLLSAIP